MSSEQFDYAVIGSGAGGSAAAYRLAKAGLKVLILERGKEMPSDASRLDIKQISSAEYRSPSGFHYRSRDGKHQEFTNLGGKTMWYGTTLMRFTDDEFEPEPSFQCPGWPVTAEEFRPFYDEAERLVGVRVFPPEKQTQDLINHFTGGDSPWTMIPQPLGLAADILQNYDYATQFNGRPMPPGVKGDAETGFLIPMKSMPNVTIVTEAFAVEMQPEPGNPRKVSAIRCKDGRVFRAKNILLAGGALNSPRLLAAYFQQTGLSKEIPGAPLVGRYYKAHLGSRLIALSLTGQTDILRKTICFRHPDYPHSVVQTWAHINPEVIFYASAVGFVSKIPSLMPAWALEQATRRMLGFLIITEEGSHYDNVVTGPVDGPPNLDYDLARTPEALEEHLSLRKAFRKKLLSAGLLLLSSRKVAGYSTSHACGTMIAGSDPKTSVVGGEGEVHGLENVWVVDGSVLPRVARVNPALTIYAWGLRTGKILADRATAPAASVSLSGAES